MSESQDTQKTFRRYARLPAADRDTRTVESRVGLGPMGNASRGAPESQAEL